MVYHNINKLPLCLIVVIYLPNGCLGGHYMLTYFDSFVDENGYTYSCDMVRINFSLCMAFDFSNFLDSYYDDVRFNIKFFINKKSVGYKYLYNYECI